MTTKPEHCAICSDELTIKNVVNALCGHQQCKTCFWKWSETSNSCPFCRADMIPRDRSGELEIKNMIERRRETMMQLDSLYDEERDVNERLNQKQRRLMILKKKIKELNCKIYQNNGILERICEWEENPGLAMTTWQQEYDKYLKSKKNLTNALENNAIRMKMCSCLREMNQKNPNLIRGLSNKYGSLPILNNNVNPVPRPWLESRANMIEIMRSQMQSPRSLNSRDHPGFISIPQPNPISFSNLENSPSANVGFTSSRDLSGNMQSNSTNFHTMQGSYNYSNNQDIIDPGPIRLMVPTRRSRRHHIMR